MLLKTISFAAVPAALLLFAASAPAQQVCLPAPRLLTLMPMGGQAGTTVEVTLTGDNLENVTALLFSSPHLTAKPVTGKDGKPSETTFAVTIAPDAPEGVYDARVLSRLGISSSRAFSVGKLPEIVRSKANTSLETALELPVNSVCNASMTRRAVDFYSFKGGKDRKVAVECGAVGLDSKLLPVLIVADATGRDLVVNRTGSLLEFTPPADATYIIKVHGLTFQGGTDHFYRLALREVTGEGPAPRQAVTAMVSSVSWPPEGLPAKAAASEVEPNNEAAQAQKIDLPCDVAGAFFPAADVDTYEFRAKKGEVWWVEVASERLGRDTDPFLLVQRVVKTGDKETLTDVAELYDIPSPVKVSSNGYSYDGPPYDVGSPDVNGKFEVAEDGVYRLQVRDLFGGTRSDPANVYRLVVRKAAPDFALASWAVHMTLRNGDRNALSKPIALRAGATMALEVVAVRKDGFDGEIELGMEGLPPGVTATGLRLAKGKSLGMMIISAAEDAKPAHGVARMFGTATVEGKTLRRPCRLASMEWPVVNAKQDIPSPRLMADVPVSVTDSEKAPVTIAAAEDKVWQAKVGETLKIPLKATWNNEFVGASLKLKAYGAGFEGVKDLDLPVKAATHEIALDLAALKVPAGEYTIALYGSAVSKYRYNPEGVILAEKTQKEAEQQAAALAAAAKQLADAANAAPTDKKSDAANAAKIAAEKQKLAEAAMAEASKKMKAVTTAATPKDTVDIIVSRPIRISVAPAQTTAKN